MSLDVYLKLNCCAVCGRGETEVFTRNITHNVNGIAEAIGVYGAVWRPEENGISKAHQVAEVLRPALEKLRANTDGYRDYRRLEPENGWGSVEGLINFLEAYLAACEQHPQADVAVWR